MQPVRDTTSAEHPRSHDTVLCTYLDSGPPPGIADYETVVILHGYVWHGGESALNRVASHQAYKLLLLFLVGNFKYLIPLAHQHRARVVVVNRRGYPGSAPFDEADLSTLQSLVSSPPTQQNAEIMLSFMRDRTKEIYDYLTRFIAHEWHTPLEGGIVLVGWSFGTVWMNAFLANIDSCPPSEVNLQSYIRRIVYYGEYEDYISLAPFSAIR